MLAKLRFINPIIAIGVIISLALSVILVLLGQDKAISVLIALAVTIVTLLIDIIARLKESEGKIVQVFAFGNALVKDPWLFGILQQIVNDYQVVKKNDFDIFIRRMESSLIDCRDTVHDLSEGDLATDILSEFSFGISGIKSTQVSIKAVQYANPSYWRTRFGEKYRQLNEEAVKRGVEVTRIWLQNRNTLIEIRDLITAQETIGIKTFVAEADDVPRELLNDFLVMDSRMLVSLEMTREGHAKQERISIDPIDIHRAENNFDLLLRYVRTLSEYYEQLKSDS